MSCITNKAVAVTGIGIVTPQALSFDFLQKDTLLKDIIEKTVTNVPLPEGQNSRELRRLSKLVKMTVSAADQALRMSGKSNEFMGTGVALTHGSTSYLAEFHDLLFSFGADSASPAAFSNGVTNAPLSTVSTMYKLTNGGITCTGLESTGIDILNSGAESVAYNDCDSFLAGASEEYSSIVDSIYRRYGWYNGVTPEHLPDENCTERGYGISEGSAFLVFEPLTSETKKRAIALYWPVTLETLATAPDLVVSGASGGPQDTYELANLRLILEKYHCGVSFTSSVFGNAFALTGVLSALCACACVKNGKNIIPSVVCHPSIRQLTKECAHVSKVLITSTSRDGQSAYGYVCASDIDSW